LGMPVVPVPPRYRGELVDVLFEVSALNRRIPLLRRRQPPADFRFSDVRRFDWTLRSRPHAAAVRVLRRRAAHEERETTANDQREKLFAHVIPPRFRAFTRIRGTASCFQARRILHPQRTADAPIITFSDPCPAVRGPTFKVRRL